MSALHRQSPVVAAQLTTAWADAPQELESLLAVHRPAAVLMFGVSARAHQFRLERTARRRNAASADVHGATYGTERNARAIEVTVTSVPCDRLAKRMRAVGHTVAISDNAGAYLCNASYYQVLMSARESCGPRHALFVHIPASLANPGFDGRGAVSGIRYDRAVRAGCTIADFIVNL